MIPHLKVPILMYHKIGGAIAHSQWWVTPLTFERQMRALKDYGYQTISFEQFLLGRQGMPLPKQPTILTFDDGYQNIYTEAFPILRRFGFTATLFTTTSFIGENNRKDNSWDIEGEEKFLARHLLWREIQEMASEGFEIGSHGVGHRALETLSSRVVKMELGDSKVVLEKRLNVPVKVFSYPFGSNDERIKDLVKEAWYEMALASGGNPMEYLDTRDLFALKRKTMTEQLSFPGQIIEYVGRENK